MPGKVRIQLHMGYMLPIFILKFSLFTCGQPQQLNQYGLFIIKNIQTYKASCTGIENKEIIALKKFIPGVVLDLRYASSNNFMHKKLYPQTTDTYLRVPAAKALQQVQKELISRQLALKIFDAYRPYSITEKMWEPVKDESYVADPAKGSNHNRGIAVDLTIIDEKTKRELDMGTGFDNFTDTAHSNFTGLPAAILNNRIILKNLMEKYGFTALETEWWHYSLPNPGKYELLDLTFKMMKKVTKKKGE
ncbi:MAG: M15 family metallopeptidase [Ginsengibacter sp.]